MWNIDSCIWRRCYLYIHNCMLSSFMLGHMALRGSDFCIPYPSPFSCSSPPAGDSLSSATTHRQDASHELALGTQANTTSNSLTQSLKPQILVENLKGSFNSIQFSLVKWCYLFQKATGDASLCLFISPSFWVNLKTSTSLPPSETLPQPPCPLRPRRDERCFH